MSSIVLLDTSIYLNILNVPGNNQDREEIFAEFKERIENGDYFLLPMATIWETGNHIADLPDGGCRYQYARGLVDDVQKALEGNSPYRATYFPDRSEFMKWVTDFPEHAKRNKSATKTTEGTSLADMTIIKEWEKTCERHSLSNVLIWSLDSDLCGYDRKPGC